MEAAGVPEIELARGDKTDFSSLDGAFSVKKDVLFCRVIVFNHVFF